MLSINSASQDVMEYSGDHAAPRYLPAAAPVRPAWTARADERRPVVDAAPADAVSRRRWSVDGLTVELLDLRAGERVELRLRSGCHVLAVYEQGSRREGETVVGREQRSSLRSFERKLVFLPS